jgi:hypothetical protein
MTELEYAKAMLPKLPQLQRQYEDGNITKSERDSELARVFTGLIQE